MADKTLPIGGGWVMITRKLPTEIQVPLLSMFYALPDRLFTAGWHSGWVETTRRVSAEQLALLWRYRTSRARLTASEIETAQKLDDEGISLDQRVRILTPDGEVWIEPYEWVHCGDMRAFFAAVDGKHITMHELGGTDQGPSFKDKLFYIQSRGIPKVDAFGLLLGEIKSRNVVWLEPHPEYARILLPPSTQKRGRKVA